MIAIANFIAGWFVGAAFVVGIYAVCSILAHRGGYRK